MSFYVESKLELETERPFGNHRRAIIYTTAPDYEDIMSAEVSGDYITRVPNTQEERGKLLVMGKLRSIHSFIPFNLLITRVSGPGKLRDNLRVIVRKYLDQKVRLHEVEFQPT